MDPAARAVWEKVKDLYPDEAAFAARIATLREQFGSLLDDEALALYVLDEHGRNEGAVVAVADARGRAEASVDVVVEQALDVREFPRGDGIGRVVNVLVRCQRGGDAARLVLWDRDVDRAFDGTLKPATKVRVVNARVKDSRFGLELHVTNWTRLEPEGAMDPARLKLLTDTRADFDPAAPLPVVAPDGVLPAAAPAAPAPRLARQATLFEAPAAGAPAREATRLDPERVADARAGDTLHLVRVRFVRFSPTRTFRRADGTTGFVADADVEDASGRGVVTLWDEAVRAARALPAGELAEVTDLVAKEKDGRLALHTTRATRIGRAE